MAPFWRISKSVFGPVSFRAVIMCVAALGMLWVRSVPVALPHSSRSIAFHSSVNHGHRQCFDHEDSQWASPPASPRTAPPPAVSSRATYAAGVLVEFVTDGWHYNRPPPIL